ncbi:endonuclease (plasmid) [Pedobacter sp. BS3]|nr:endonuclease [Pedobacter sp. BS3]
MTYNVHHCNPPAKADVIDVAAIARVINTEDPDFVALQEIDVNTTRSGTNLNEAQELARLTGRQYFFAKALDYGGGEYGVAILSKYLIQESGQQLLPMKAGVPYEQRTVAWITVQLQNGKKLIFAATHFDSQEHRLLQAEKICEIFKDKPYPVILGGDFNDGPGSEAINYLDKYFSRTCPKTCYNTAPATFPTKAIDLIFFKPANALEVIKNNTVLEKNASDHLPLVAQFKINDY